MDTEQVKINAETKKPIPIKSVFTIAKITEVITTELKKNKLLFIILFSLTKYKFTKNKTNPI